MVRLAMLIWVALALAGCGPQVWHSDSPREMPVDFDLVFTVEGGEGDGAGDKSRQASHYVLESDRTLRVALGPGAGERTYPPPTATLSPAAMQRVYRLARPLLEIEPAAPTAAKPGDARYRITLSAHGRRRTIVTTPDESPAAAALLAHLVDLRGGVARRPRTGIMTDSPPGPATPQHPGETHRDD